MATKNKNKFKEAKYLLENFPLTPKQQDALKIMLDEKTRIVFIRGYPGTGKTTLAMYAALSLLRNEDIKNIKYIRTVVESAERSVGLLPGDISDKFDVYTGPLYEKLNDLLSPAEFTALQDSKCIESRPVNFLRGADWRFICAVCDELQNFSIKEILTVLTRINTGTKVFCAFDPNQADVKKSGAQLAYEIFDNEESKKHGIFCVDFGPEECHREEVISYVSEKLSSLSKNLV